MVPLFLPLGISLFCFDFAGCGESDGEYISLGWFERDDLDECVKYLRNTEKVSAIGLWGRSMGAVTALLHADRDHSIGGMVLDSPFCNLRQLASELAQSEYLSVKVPSWLLSGALAFGRMRIKSLCNFDIDQLAPEQHVGNSFIPALFIHGEADDFIAPHHTKTLFEAYNGDKELEIVDGDHNSQRALHVIQKAVMFFCRAFRCNLAPSQITGGDLSSLLGFDAVAVDATLDQRVLGRSTLYEAAKLIAMAGSEGKQQWLGERQRPTMPFRLEGALQVQDATAEAGFCISLIPLPTEYGGINRPPVVMLALASANGLQLLVAVEGREPEVVAQLQQTGAKLEIGVPALCFIEIIPSEDPPSYYGPVRPPRLRLGLAPGGPDILFTLPEEYDSEVLVIPLTRGGSAEFFDIDLKDLITPPEPPTPPPPVAQVEEPPFPPAPRSRSAVPPSLQPPTVQESVSSTCGSCRQS